MRIGIILTGDYSWAGGVYYSLNIIKLLQQISKNKDLKIVVIVNAATPAELIAELPSENIEINYLDKRSFVYKLLHRLKNDRFVADINGLNLDVLYPLISYNASHKSLNCKVVYWMYDFQHKFLPELFTNEEIKSRDLTFQNISSNAMDIVFSSQDSKSHFEKYYPQSKATKYVYSFVSLIQKPTNQKKENHTVPDNYFIVCNQFWPHKNHLSVLKALTLLIKTKNNTHVVFTGNFDGERNSKYVAELKIFISENQLDKNITLTGFISREEQISLIVNAKAVIQPSFFEGWSTVVEDAKALNKFLILSDIPVNREQVDKNVLFFPVDNFEKLAESMAFAESAVVEISDYSANIEQSKTDLIKLFKI